jgi:DNA replication protein DnaC
VPVGEIFTPFDEFENPSRSATALRPKMIVLRIQAGLRLLSSASLWVAIVTASFLILRHVLPFLMGSDPSIPFKSAIPLIAIGISYFVLIISLRRTFGQRLAGVFIGLAFVLWGLEQFLSDKVWSSFIDDVVVFLFVVDLSIVIRHHLRNCNGEHLVRKANFPVVKTIETFEFAAQPSINEALVRSLLKGSYIERRENIVIVGKPGTGKTHLALAAGYAACFQRKRVLFTTASALVAELIDSHENRRFRRFSRQLERLDLLIVDEVGYVHFSELGGQLFFELLRTAHERLSLVLTTTIPPERWGEVFKSQSAAKAAADRLTGRRYLLEATGDSYRKPGRNAIVGPLCREDF